jgi:hypothetical protein
MTADDEPLIFGWDPARSGRDLSVLARRRGGRVYDSIIVPKGDLMAQVGFVVDLVCKSRPHPAAVCVDSIGLGSGVADRLREVFELRGILPYVQVVDVIASSRAPDDEEHFANLKTWCAHRLAARAERGDLSLPVQDRELVSDLMSYRSILSSSGRLRIEDRKDRSPDRGDALLLTFAAGEDIGPSLFALPRDVTFWVTGGG